jgi:apolipoprotein D and lipocalin family protein
MHDFKSIFLFLVGFSMVLPALAGVSTKTIPPVEGFDLNRYLGTWYEIARMPHRFEKGLSRVTAEYSLFPDGKVRVLNKGFKTEKNKWSEAKGKAWVPDPAAPARLKVRFFWPFSAEYKIIRLDPEYGWAVVTSGSTDYLWILCRRPVMDEALYQSLVQFLKDNGFDTNRLIRVEQEAGAGP